MLRVDPVQPELVQVGPRSNFYLVDPQRKTCSCTVSKLGELCAHRLAVGLRTQGPNWAYEAMMNRFHDYKIQLGAVS